MSRLRCAVLFLALACGLASCRPAATPTSVTLPAEAPTKRLTAVHPQAVSVRMTVVEDVLVDRKAWKFERRERSPPGGYPLSPEQSARLRRAMLDTPVLEAQPACFIPHHFFHFYDRAGREVGSAAICFCCGGAQAEPALVGAGRELGYKTKEVRALVEELGSRTDVGCKPNIPEEEA